MVWTNLIICYINGKCNVFSHESVENCGEYAMKENDPKPH